MPDLEPITKEQLYTEIVALKERNMQLEYQLAQVNRLLFGQKRERFVASEQPQQATLFSTPNAEKEEKELLGTAVENSVKAAEAVVKKKGQIAGKPNPNHAGRNEFPAHLPRVVEILTSPIVENNPLGFKKIGQIVTETLDYTPAKLFVRQRVREKYVAKMTSTSQNEPQNTVSEQGITEGVIIAPMPDRPLPKAIADAGLLAQVLVDKFVDHLPIDRQAKRWKRESGIDIKGSTVVGWIDGTCQLLQPLYEKLTELVFDTAYLQADETTLKSLENAPKGKTHTSYQWVYRNTEKDLILFDYQRGRSGECLHPMVKKHQGVLQTDGYKVYAALNGLPNLKLANCWAHARRKFFDARQNDPQKAEIALGFIQKLYKIEDEAREQNVSKVAKDELLQRRQQKSTPILIEFKEWLDAQLLKTLPKSPIGIAIAYALNRWAKLTLYTTDPNIEIDNNRIENAIRPLALGRKNYLFVGSDEGGSRTAMMYAFFASCHAHNVNPLAWLTDVLIRMPNHPINKIDELLPHIWKVEGA